MALECGQRGAIATRARAGQIQVGRVQLGERVVPREAPRVPVRDDGDPLGVGDRRHEIEDQLRVDVAGDHHAEDVGIGRDEDVEGGGPHHHPRQLLALDFRPNGEGGVAAHRRPVVGTQVGRDHERVAADVMRSTVGDHATCFEAVHVIGDREDQRQVVFDDDEGGGQFGL